MPPQPVEPGDAEPIPGPGMVDELGEAGALESFSGHDVDEHPDGAGFDEPDSLALEVLVVGEHARVTQRVASAGRVTRTKIVRFGDGFDRHTGALRERGLNRLFIRPFIVDRLGIETGIFGTVPCLRLALFRHRNGPRRGRAGGYRLDFRQPAARASASVQNHRSPREVSMRVFA